MIMMESLLALRDLESLDVSKEKQQRLVSKDDQLGDAFAAIT